MRSSGSSEPLRRQYSRIASVVATYWVISISIVFLNKWLLSGSRLNAPLFVTFSQCVITIALIQALMRCQRFCPKALAVPRVEFERKRMLRVLPLSLVFVGMIASNNLCLQHVGVSFYYVGRCLSTVFNLLFTYYLLGEKTSMRALGCCLLIVGGYLLGVREESGIGSLSSVGVIFGLLASMFTALNAIYTKKVLPLVDHSIWRLSLYNNCNACLLLAPLSLAFDDLSGLFDWALVGRMTFWLALLGAGIFGFLIGFVSGLQIQVTSPLTHNVSGTAKAALQTLLAVAAHGEVKPLLWWTSNAIVLFGFSAYSVVRREEMRERAQAAAVREGAEEALFVKQNEVEQQSDEDAPSSSSSGDSVVAVV